MDCIVVKARQNGGVISKAVFLALGINTEGQKELLGMWLAENEGAKFWLSVLTGSKILRQLNLFLQPLLHHPREGPFPSGW